MNFKNFWLKTTKKFSSFFQKFSKTSSKSFKIVIILLLAGTLGYFARSLIFAARVNGQFITRISLIRELEKQGGRDVLDSLVIKAIIFQEAKKKGIGVSDEEINAEVSRIEQIVSSQGSTLDEALALQGQNRADFIEQIKVQKLVEKILADKIIVTDEEAQKYFEDNKDLFGEDAKYEDAAENAKNQLMQEKLSSAYQSWIGEARGAASINYFVDFK